MGVCGFLARLKAQKTINKSKISCNLTNVRLVFHLSQKVEGKVTFLMFDARTTEFEPMQPK